jgi:hypothetical protein
VGQEKGATIDSGGGDGGIRTREPLTRLSDLQSPAFNRSATSPRLSAYHVPEPIRFRVLAARAFVFWPTLPIGVSSAG